MTIVTHGTPEPRRLPACWQHPTLVERPRRPRRTPTAALTPIVTLRDAKEQPLLLECDGVSFRREDDQVRAQRSREANALRDELRALGSDQAVRLADRLVNLAWQDAIDEQGELMHRIGMDVLMANSRPDLWLLVYLQYNQDAAYVLGDEMRFLFRQPRGETA